MIPLVKIKSYENLYDLNISRKKLKNPQHIDKWSSIGIATPNKVSIDLSNFGHHCL